MWLSYDKQYYIIEETPSSHILDKAVAIKMSQNDTNWCTKCWVYLIVNVEVEQRYYITSIAKLYNDPLSR